MSACAVGRLRPLTSNDLELILEWRNHPDIRRFMYSTHEISPSEHRQWFESASKDKGRYLCIFESDGHPCGFVSFTGAEAGSIAEWGFYSAPTATRGTGRALGKVALRFAFLDLGVHKVCGQALRDNVRSIEMHQSLGFTTEGIRKEQHFDGVEFHDVLCFGLLCAEWRIVEGAY